MDRRKLYGRFHYDEDGREEDRLFRRVLFADLSHGNEHGFQRLYQFKKAEKG